MLFRVTGLAQDLFYIFSEFTWGDKVVLNILRVDDDMIIEANVSFLPYQNITETAIC